MVLKIDRYFISNAERYSFLKSNQPYGLYQRKTIWKSQQEEKEDGAGKLVSWCFEPSQPQRIIRAEDGGGDGDDNDDNDEQ